MNLYGYAAGDPINNHDPFGLCSKVATLAAVADGPLPVGEAAFAVVCLWRASTLLGKLFNALLAETAPEEGTAGLDIDARTGKLKGDVPDGVSDDLTETELEERSRALDGSIKVREREMRQKGGNPGHKKRIEEERRHQRQIEDRLKQLQQPDPS